MYDNAQRRPLVHLAFSGGSRLKESNSVHDEEADVAARLSAIGLQPDWLRDSVQQGLADGAQCTANDPVILRSLLDWGKTVGYVRDHLLVHGWQRSRRFGYETVVSPDGSLAIAVAAGDAGTGMKDMPVRTRSPKGPATDVAILVNTGATTIEMSELFASFPAADPLPTNKTWILLFYADDEENEIRVELSLPTGLADDRQVAVWGQRLILPPITWGVPSSDELHNDGLGDGDGPIVEVKRR